VYPAWITRLRVLDEGAGDKNRDAVVGAGQALIARDLQGETFHADKDQIRVAGFGRDTTREALRVLGADAFRLGPAT
jgi:hypothetical protein